MQHHSVNIFLVVIVMILMYPSYWQDTADFDMQFDKLYKWTASSIAEKLSFIETLWKVNIV